MPEKETSHTFKKKEACREREESTALVSKGKAGSRRVPTVRKESLSQRAQSLRDKSRKKVMAARAEDC